MMTSASADSRKSASERWDLAPLASTYEPSSRDKIPSKMSMPGLVDPSHDTDRELRVEWNRGSEAFSETLRLETCRKGRKRGGLLPRSMRAAWDHASTMNLRCRMVALQAFLYLSWTRKKSSNPCPVVHCGTVEPKALTSRSFPVCE
jgi:hypothetical protein